MEYIPFRRSGGSRRRRVALALTSLAALFLLVKLATEFFGSPAAMPGDVLVVAALLIVGIVWGLRPWAR